MRIEVPDGYSGQYPTLHMSHAILGWFQIVSIFIRDEGERSSLLYQVQKEGKPTERIELMQETNLAQSERQDFQQLGFGQISNFDPGLAIFDGEVYVLKFTSPDAPHELLSVFCPESSRDQQVRAIVERIYQWLYASPFSTAKNPLGAGPFGGKQAFPPLDRPLIFFTFYRRPVS